MSLRSPRSKTILVVLFEACDRCSIRNDNEGTVRRASSSAGVMKNLSGKVRDPVLKAWTDTVAMVEAEHFQSTKVRSE